MPGIHHRGRRARSVLRWAVVVFLVLQIGIGLVLDYGWPLLRFPSAARILAGLPKDPSSIDVVFLGSSRFQVGVAAEEIAALLERDRGRPCTALNAAVPCGDLIAAEFMLTLLREKGVKPGLLVLEISPET